MTSLFGAAICLAIGLLEVPCASEAQVPLRSDSVPQKSGIVREPQRVIPASAASPVVQQSPNGLYGLSITDAGIELRGPSGGVKITDAGIEIGASNSSRVTISATGMELWGDKTLQLNAREKVEMVNGPGANIVRLSPTGLELKVNGGGTVQLTPGGMVEITNGSSGPGKNVVRLSTTGMELNTGGTAQLKAAGTLEIINGKGPATNTVTLSTTGMALRGGGAVEITSGPGSANVVKLSNGVELTVGGTSVKVGTGGTSLTGRVTLGCPEGRPAARSGDAVGVGPDGRGAIGAGSTTVLICN